MPQKLEIYSKKEEQQEEHAIDPEIPFKNEKLIE